MITMNISIPEALTELVDDQVSARGYGSLSEYVRELIRKDLDRQRLRDLVLEGAASPRAGFADEEYFARLHGDIDRQDAPT